MLIIVEDYKIQSDFSINFEIHDSYQTLLHAFFIRNAYFQLSLGVA